VHEAEEQILDSERNCDENNDFFEAADVLDEVFEVLFEGFKEKKVAADAEEHEEKAENEVHRKQHFIRNVGGEGKLQIGGGVEYQSLGVAFEDEVNEVNGERVGAKELRDFPAEGESEKDVKGEENGGRSD